MGRRAKTRKEKGDLRNVGRLYTGLRTINGT
jgi:hypothetical protein